MKKFVYISGIISANLMFFGSMFKVMHFPGAGILLTLSIAFFSIMFLPFALYHVYQNSESKKYKLLFIISYFVFAFVFVGALFKIMHWPGAGWFLIIGIPLPLVLFLPVYLIQTARDKDYSMVNFMGIMFGMTFLTVFSALLSVNVTSYILQDSEDQFNYNERMVEMIVTKSTENPTIVQDEAEELYKLLNEFRNELLLASGNNIDMTKNGNLINIDDNKIIYQVFYDKRNKDLLQNIRTKMVDFKISLSNSVNLTPDLQELSNNLLNIENCLNEEYFSRYNTIIALEFISRIARNVKFIENELLARN